MSLFFFIFDIKDMGIKNFFKKLWGGVKKTAGKIWGGIKKGAQWVGKVAKKIATPVLSIAKPVLGVMSALPGHAGAIGRIGSAAAGIAQSVVDKIPNAQAREKLTQVIDKGKGLVDKVQDKATDLANKGASAAATANKYIAAGKDIVKNTSLAPIKQAIKQ